MASSFGQASWTCWPQAHGRLGVRGGGQGQAQNRPGPVHFCGQTTTYPRARPGCPPPLFPLTPVRANLAHLAPHRHFQCPHPDHGLGAEDWRGALSRNQLCRCPGRWHRWEHPTTRGRNSGLCSEEHAPVADHWLHLDLSPQVALYLLSMAAGGGKEVPGDNGSLPCQN